MMIMMMMIIIIIIRLHPSDKVHGGLNQRLGPISLNYPESPRDSLDINGIGSSLVQGPWQQGMPGKLTLRVAKSRAGNKIGVQSTNQPTNSLTP